MFESPEGVHRRFKNLVTLISLGFRLAVEIVDSRVQRIRAKTQESMCQYDMCHARLLCGSLQYQVKCCITGGCLVLNFAHSFCNAASYTPRAIFVSVWGILVGGTYHSPMEQTVR